VAITGGIGAGKSAALAAFGRHGAATRSSDEIVHRLLRSDPDVQRKLVERFGPEVIGSEGADRAAVGRIVFNDPEQLDWLEELLHPRVVQDHTAWRQELAEGPDPPAVTVTEVPLLYETGGDNRFDIVVVITAPQDVRAKRRPMADDREQRLLPEDEKIRLGDYAYVNDGTLCWPRSPRCSRPSRVGGSGCGIRCPISRSFVATRATTISTRRSWLRSSTRSRSSSPTPGRPPARSV
jgi:dephospho-CoA kinase